MSGTELIIHGEASLSSLQVYMTVYDIIKQQAACVLNLLKLNDLTYSRQSYLEILGKLGKLMFEIIIARNTAGESTLY